MVKKIDEQRVNNINTVLALIGNNKITILFLLILLIASIFAIRLLKNKINPNKDDPKYIVKDNSNNDWHPKKTAEALFLITQSWQDEIGCYYNGNTVEYWLTSLLFLNESQLQTLCNYWNDFYKTKSGGYDIPIIGNYGGGQSLIQAIQNESAGLLSCLTEKTKQDVLLTLKIANCD